MDEDVVNVEYRTCNCSNKHVPKPHKLIKVDWVGTDVYLCPTSYWNLRSLREQWYLCGGEPPGVVRKHYSEYIQSLAKTLELG